MDCKIISRLIFFIIFFTTTQLNAIEFRGKFLQGHYIVGITDPAAKIIVGKKKVKVSKDGYFVFGIDRDRKFDVIITKIIDGKKDYLRLIPYTWELIDLRINESKIFNDLKKLLIQNFKRKFDAN